MLKKTFLSFLLLVAVPLSDFAGGDKQPNIGKSAPLFELATLKGDTVALANLQGKFVVVHYAASW